MSDSISAIRRTGVQVLIHKPRSPFMRIKRLVAALSLAAGIIGGTVAVTTAPASGLAFQFGMTGDINVHDDMGACASVSAPSGTLLVGQFTAVAEGQGPGTRVGTVRWSEPIVAVGSWSSCVSGAFVPQFGEGRYTLTVTSAGANDYVEAQQCSWTFGSKTCI